MITKIFYSLVLFPCIQYDIPLQGGFLLISVEEISFGCLHLVFQNNGTRQDIIFTHCDHIKDNIQLQTKNWNIFCDNKELEQEIIALILINDNRDFNFFKENQYYRDHAFGIVLTITSKCNIYCYYCFNDIDYDLKERNTRKNFGLDYWKNIVDHLYENGTRVVILTGGEPMVAPFLWELLDYLKEKQMFVHINTNGVLLGNKNLKKLNDNYSINLMVSMHEFNNEDYFEVNRKGLEMTFHRDNMPKSFNTLFTDKLEQLRKVQTYKNISLEFLTILVWKNILNLEKIYEFGRKCGVEFHAWQFFRLYGTKNNTGATSAMMDLAVNKMYLLNKKYGVAHKIVDPVPFCVTKNTERAREVIDGVLSDSHDVKTIITTRGFVQMMSAYDNNFWNINDMGIDEIFKSEFVEKQLNNGFLPKDCHDCSYKEECRGGSRMDANIMYGDYGEFDPIGNIKNKKTINSL